MNSSYPWNSSNISKLLVIIFSLYSKNLHRTLVVISVCSKMASRKISLQNRAYSTLSDCKKDKLYATCFHHSMPFVYLLFAINRQADATSTWKCSSISNEARSIRNAIDTVRYKMIEVQ